MKLLAPSPSQIHRILPEIPACTQIPMAPAFHHFLWDDESCSEPGCFEVKQSDLSILYDFEKCGGLGVIEEFSRTSQFDRLRNWQGPAIFALAMDGRGFHGQHDRAWKTGSGNLYLCMAIPVDLPISCAHEIQQFPAIILASEVNQICAPQYQALIKAPNDVIILPKDEQTPGKPHKISGYLTELRIQGDRIAQVRYGIGCNIQHAPVQTDPGHLPAIALKEIMPQGAEYLRNSPDLLQFFAAQIIGRIFQKFQSSNSQL